MLLFPFPSLQLILTATDNRTAPRLQVTEAFADELCQELLGRCV